MRQMLKPIASIFVLSIALLIAAGPRGAATAPIAQSATSTIPQYTFDINLDYGAHRVDAVEQVKVTNPDTQTISGVVFNVPAAHTAGLFKLRSIQVNGQPAAYDFADTLLSVKLPAPLQPDQSVLVSLSFGVDVPPLGNPQSFAAADLAYSDVALNVGYWYPLLAPYRLGSGWVNVPWAPIGDPFAGDSADYQATITATPGVTIVSGGTMTHSGNVWQVNLPRGRTLGLIASPYYQPASVKFGNVTYSTYLLPQHAYLAPITLQTMIRALALYTALYGPYPYADLRIAEFSGPWSMEFGGFCLLGTTEFDDYDGGFRNRLIRIAAHEISHQWWYGVVGDDQAREPWLDEGLARFNEVRYYEAYSPQDVAWWWAAIIRPNAPTAPLNSAVYDFHDHGSYLNSVYDQGATFLNTLRSEIGVDTFNSFLHDLYTRESFRMVTTQDFFNVLKEHTAVDLAPLIRRFFK